jgi:hypothetical protein
MWYDALAYVGYASAVGYELCSLDNLDAEMKGAG